ncbi:hypothetical protein GCM10010168_38340 [Actinoplanes ianthinogenes]|uniref:Uncharacterized protein n=1 Tax=Actinoplanes ianthinogenes TaxID=122358 RepID=A0ABM7M4X5_9ACTN|nr:hypothetical protein Aiant_73000 [Actinoplanes ianthinogenes]GGR16707.1 hypothetical protein GCM10010168_38340 [Actinoplanes ianthinogenes]
MGWSIRRCPGIRTHQSDPGGSVNFRRYEQAGCPGRRVRAPPRPVTGGDDTRNLPAPARALAVHLAPWNLFPMPGGTPPDRCPAANTRWTVPGGLGRWTNGGISQS